MHDPLYAGGDVTGTPPGPTLPPRRYVALYCEAEDEYHDAMKDPDTGACPACSAPPESFTA